MEGSECTSLSIPGGRREADCSVLYHSLRIRELERYYGS